MADESSSPDRPRGVVGRAEFDALQRDHESLAAEFRSLRIGLIGDAIMPQFGAGAIGRIEASMRTLQDKLDHIPQQVETSIAAAATATQARYFRRSLTWTVSVIAAAAGTVIAGLLLLHAGTTSTPIPLPTPTPVVTLAPTTAPTTAPAKVMP